MTRVERWLLVTATGAALAALVLGVGGTDFWPPDEARVAEIAREMAESHDWLIPKLDGRPFLEEPPLFYWLQAATYRVVGVSTVAARLPAAAAGILGVLATAALARRVGANPLVAAIVIATAPEYWWMARSATPDMAGAAAAGVALAAFFVAWQSGRRKALVVTALALAAAFWCKSLLPVGLAVLAIAAFVVTAGRGRIRFTDLAGVAVGGAVLASVWLGLLVRDVGGQGALFFVVTNHFGRLAGVASQGHVRPPWYYVPNLALDFFPWSLVLPVAILAAWRARRTPERLFPLTWAAVMLVALTFSASKRAHYLLPAYPAFALLVAQWWPDAWRGRADRAARRLLVLTIAVAGPGLALVLVTLHAERLLAAASLSRAAAASLLADSSTGLVGWSIAVAFLLIGLALLRIDRAQLKLGVAAAVGLYLGAIQMVLTVVVLPRLNTLCTARPLAERLSHLADRGVRVVALGATEDQNLALSALRFYAGRPLATARDPEALVAALRTGAGCGVMRRQDYASLSDVLPGAPVPEHALEGFRLVVVETTPGVCGGAERAPPA